MPDRDGNHITNDNFMNDDFREIKILFIGYFVLVVILLIFR